MYTYRTHPTPSAFAHRCQHLTQQSPTKLNQQIFFFFFFAFWLFSKDHHFPYALICHTCSIFVAAFMTKSLSLANLAARFFTLYVHMYMKCGTTVKRNFSKLKIYQGHAGI